MTDDPTGGPQGPVDDWDAYDLARFWEHVVTSAPSILQFGDGNGSLNRRRRPVPLLQIVRLAREAEAGRFANDRDPMPGQEQSE